MTTLLPGSILAKVSDEVPFTTSMRLLVVNADMCWVIPLDFADHRKYSRGPVPVSCIKLERWLDEGKLRIAEFERPKIWTASDEDLNRRYGGSAQKNCAIVEARETAMAAIETLVERYCSDMVGALTKGSYTEWIDEASKTGPHHKAYLYDAFHRYLAADNKQVLLGDTYRNGGRGSPKKQTRKLGRRNADDAAANSESSGYALNDHDKLKIACGWESFVTDGRSTRTAYLETMGTFYADRIEIVNGTETPILKPANQRPTQRQFNYWGPRDDPAQSATRRMLGEHEYRLNHRGLPGSASNDVLLIGQRAWTDSSGGDVRLASVFSRCTEVGVATFTCIVEARTEVIPGVYIGFERPSARTQLLAAAHAALPKADWCARFGIHGVTEDQIPALRLDEIAADNGEARNGEVIRVSLKAWEGWIEYVRAGDGTAKGSVEGEHHVRHREVDHLLPGTTHSPGRQARNESPAILNYYEYVAHHIRRIIYHNSVQPAPHLVMGEMRGELSAFATRMDVFRWLMKHGYINGKPPDAEMIRAHMLPSFPASITKHGVFLHRPDRGGKKEYVLACRFVGKYLNESGLLEAARRNGVIPAEVSLDPNDLSVAWFRTRDFGLERLENVDRDRWLIQHATLHELLFLQDRDQRERLQNSTKFDQDAFNFLHERDAHSSVAVEQYNIAQERTAASPQGQDAPNSAAARRTETTLLEKSGLADPVGKFTYVPRTTSALTGDKAPAAQPLPAASAASVTSPSSDIADDVLAAIDKFIKKDS